MKIESTSLSSLWFQISTCASTSWGEPVSDDDEESSDDEDGPGPTTSRHGGTVKDASASIYGSKAYWDDRYTDGVIGASTEKGETSNEWYVGYAQLKELLLRYMARRCRLTSSA